MTKLYAILALTLSTLSLSAQWTSNTSLNTLVAGAQTSDIEAVGTSDGKTYVAFWHDVPAPAYYEMRLQLLDQNGNPLFGAEGLLVNNTATMSSYTTLWSLTVDRDNNAIIGFNETDGNGSVYFHKISPSGVQLWNPNGVVLGAGFDPKALPLSTGETIVCWLPGNQGVFQKLDASGVPVWAAPVTIAPGVTNHKSSAGELAELPGGDFMMMLHDRGGFSPSSIPYAQRYSAATGAAVWAQPLLLTSGVGLSFNRRYTMVQDGDHVYLGYGGALGLQLLSYLQRIDADGTLPWGPNGKDFSTQSLNYEQDTKIAYTPGSDAIWAICTYTDPSQGQGGEYVQKFDKLTGARLLSDTAKLVYPISADYYAHAGDLQLVDDQPLFVITKNNNGVFAYDLLAVYLDAQGNFVWPTHTKPLGTNTVGAKNRVKFNRAVDGQAVCTWVEARSNGISLPFAQNIVAKANSTVHTPSTLVQASVYPNPASGSFSLALDMKHAAEVSYALSTTDGRQVLQQSLNLHGGLQFIQIDGSNLAPGMYWLRACAGEETVVLKLVIAR